MVSASTPPTWEDHLRAFTYLVFATWPPVFFLFTPVSYVSALEWTTLFIWMGPTFLGALVAALGAILRIDFKLELPGLILMLVGPGFYMIAQAWYSAFPPDTSLVASDRYHLVILSLYLFVVHFPRIAHLQMGRSRARRIRQQHDSLPELTEGQKAQPGAFPELEADEK